MGRFSLKQMMASTALAAVGICMALQIDYGRSPKRPIDVLLWFSMWPVFGVAILNLWNVPILRSAKVGFVVGMFAAMFWGAVAVFY